MSKYVNNAIFFLCTAAVLVLCIGTYLGASTLTDIDEQIVKCLPFGNFIWEAYAVRCVPGYLSNAGQALSHPFLSFTLELAKFFVTWAVYRLLLRNAVKILMFAYCDGTGHIFDRMKSAVFYSIGYVIAALLASYLLQFLGGLFGTSTGGFALQTGLYLIIAAAIGIVFAFVLTKLAAPKAIAGAVTDGVVQLVLSAAFFIFLHFLSVNQAISAQLLTIVIMAVGIHIMLSVLDLD